MACLKRQLAKTITGIGHQRRSGVRYQRHGFSGLQRGNELRSRFIGIVFVIGERTRADAITLKQDAGDAGILAGENIGRGQRFQRADGDIAKIADGCGDEIKRRLQRPRRNGGRADPEFLRRLSGIAVRYFLRHTASNHSGRPLPAGRSGFFLYGQ